MAKPRPRCKRAHYGGARWANERRALRKQLTAAERTSYTLVKITGTNNRSPGRRSFTASGLLRVDLPGGWTAILERTAGRRTIARQVK